MNDAHAVYCAALNAFLMANHSKMTCTMDQAVVVESMNQAQLVADLWKAQHKETQPVKATMETQAKIRIAKAPLKKRGRPKIN